MTFLETLVETRWAEAVGWTLIHSLWQGLIVAVVLGIVLLATQSPRVRYAVGMVAMMVMVTAFAATFFELVWRTAGDGLPAGRVPFPNWRQAVPQAAAHWEFSLALIAPWLAPFWFGGVLVFYARYVTGFLSLARLSRRGVCAAPAIWDVRLSALRAKVKVSGPVRLLESSLVEAPILMGHFRPLILLPLGLLTSLPTTQIESILLHELAHIRRHDYLLNALQNLVDGLLFYNPALWWISHVVRSEREKCCDDVVVEVSGNAHEYARALAALEETRWSGREPAVAAQGVSIMKRIRRLLYPAAPSSDWSPVLAASIVLVAAAMTLGAWQQSDAPRSRVVLKACPPDEAHSNAAAGDYQKWLNEDVFYIIDDAERQAFLKLPTDEARACFVYQFWERRNPTPGSQENKFKAEHYRRIAYANAHFGASVPGWQTDRGHMYIVYGPPDEIDSHTDAKPHAYESWGYRHVEGLAGGFSTFMFVDRSGHGDYHLAPSNGK